MNEQTGIKWGLVFLLSGLVLIDAIATGIFFMFLVMTGAFIYFVIPHGAYWLMVYCVCFAYIWSLCFWRFCICMKREEK